MSAPAVVGADHHLAYGSTWALDGIDIDVARGSTLGVLGHNGAGKTTLIRVLTTLVPPNVGRVTVDGLDVAADADQVRQRIGVTGQFAGLDEFLTGRENLELVARLVGLRQRAQRRASELIDLLDLHDVAQRRVGELSGGSRRRIDLAASLIGSPAVLFLDEPTTGLDPTGRADLWNTVEELTATGTTVVLTTQYLEEADRLADHIVVLDHGRVAARGTPGQLKGLVGGKVVSATIDHWALDQLPHTPDGSQPASQDQVTVTFNTDDAEAAMRVVADLAAAGVDVGDLEITSPSLDDVFNHLTTTGARP
jgi:ABC-2 type transport system ATP-binding protein